MCGGVAKPIYTEREEEERHPYGPLFLVSKYERPYCDSRVGNGIVPAISSDLDRLSPPQRNK